MLNSPFKILTNPHNLSFIVPVLSYPKRVIKIQKVWRGVMGRQRMGRLYLLKQKQDGFKIKGLYYIWLYKRKCYRKKLTALNSAVSTIQGLFRFRKAMRVVALMRARRQDRMVTIFIYINE